MQEDTPDILKNILKYKEEYVSESNKKKKSHLTT